MTEENKTVEPNGNDAQPAAEPLKTEKDHMIPKARFDEVNAKMKGYEKQLKAKDKALKENQDARLKEIEDYKTLYETAVAEMSELRPKADRVDNWKETLESIYEAQKLEIPEELRTLIPEQLAIDQKLSWIATNKALLTKPSGPDLGAGQRGTGGGKTEQTLTAEEKMAAELFGMTDKEYVDNKSKEDA